MGSGVRLRQTHLQRGRRVELDVMTVSHPTPRLRLEGISKHFPGCKANDDIHLSIKPGEIHALLGENGAGKSTLVKIIYGLLQPDSGKLFWAGKPMTIKSPQQARALGIGMVFQHFSLFEALTVVENIAVGMDRPPKLKVLRQQIQTLSDTYGLQIHAHHRVRDLSVGERQRVEIIRCLLQHPQLLIMDEPTSVLTPQEADQLFVVLKQLQRGGVSVLYISHKLEEIRQLCDRATILRQGRFVAECDPSQQSAHDMATLMVGDDIPALSKPDMRQKDQVLLQVNQLHLQSDNDFGVDLANLSFEVKAGQIFGIAGIAGNGQTELLAALSGETLTANDTLVIDNAPCGQQSPKQRRRRGITYVPEERLGHGAVPNFSLANNALLSAYHTLKLTTHGWIRKQTRDRFTQTICDRYRVKHTGIHSPANSLSGGNLQKFIVGRELEQQPRILIAAQPTWGVDAGAASAIHQAFIELTARGCAIVLVSQDLDELFALSDQIAVLYDGHLSPAMATEAVSQQTIGLLMSGKTPTTEPS